jgi:hypothetical protein
MKRYLPVLFVALIWASCAKDEENPPIDLGYDYFPVKIGHFIEYAVDSIAYDSEGDHDTLSYFVREVIESEIVDALKEPALRIERYKKDSLDHDWELVDIWSAKRTSNNAQRIEEDKRYIRLVFPITNSAQWDGNALNTEEEWTHVYSEIGTSRNYDSLSFENTVTVLQREFKSLIDDQYAYEVYAPGIGLIEKYYRVLETNVDYTIDPVGENILGGVEYHFRIMDYGEEE